MRRYIFIRSEKRLSFKDLEQFKINKGTEIFNSMNDLREICGGRSLHGYLEYKYELEVAIYPDMAEQFGKSLTTLSFAPIGVINEELILPIVNFTEYCFKETKKGMQHILNSTLSEPINEAKNKVMEICKNRSEQPLTKYIASPINSVIKSITGNEIANFNSSITQLKELSASEKSYKTLGEFLDEIEKVWQNLHPALFLLKENLEDFLYLYARFDPQSDVSLELKH